MPNTRSTCLPELPMMINVSFKHLLGKDLSDSLDHKRSNLLSQESIALVIWMHPVAEHACRKASLGRAVGDPDRRLRRIQTGSPRIDAVVEGSDGGIVEGQRDDFVNLGFISKRNRGFVQ